MSLRSESLADCTAPPLQWCLGGGAVANAHAPSGSSEWPGVVSALAAADELTALSEPNALLKRAVELAQQVIGLERAAIYLCDRLSPCTLRGTWGTGAGGEIVDERGLKFTVSDADYEVFRSMPLEGSRWLYSASTDHMAQRLGRLAPIGRGWMVVTPLIAGGQVLGLMFNDTALSHAPVDEAKQVRAAVFCSLLAGLIISKRGAAPRRIKAARGECSPLVQRVVRRLKDDPLIRGQRLAREMGISSGHLARVFRAEMGLSLVEHRNRLRIERFLSLVGEGSESLLDAALSAGFGSYAQFHRVFRKLIGTTPREYLLDRRGNSAVS